MEFAHFVNLIRLGCNVVGILALKISSAFRILVLMDIVQLVLIVRVSSVMEYHVIMMIFVLLEHVLTKYVPNAPLNTNSATKHIARQIPTVPQTPA